MGHLLGGDNTMGRSNLQFNYLHVETEKKTGDTAVRSHNRRDQSRTCVLQPIVVIGDAHEK